MRKMKALRHIEWVMHIRGDFTHPFDLVLE